MPMLPYLTHLTTGTIPHQNGHFGVPLKSLHSYFFNNFVLLSWHSLPARWKVIWSSTAVKKLFRNKSTQMRKIGESEKWYDKKWQPEKWRKFLINWLPLVWIAISLLIELIFFQLYKYTYPWIVWQGFE